MCEELWTKISSASCYKGFYAGACKTDWTQVRSTTGIAGTSSWPYTGILSQETQGNNGQ